MPSVVKGESAVAENFTGSGSGSYARGVVITQSVNDISKSRVLAHTDNGVHSLSQSAMFKRRVAENDTQDVYNNVTTVANEPSVIRGYVGFANIPNQVYRKAIKRGFEFTLMVVGQSGLGKSTFINALFLAEIYNSGVQQSFHSARTIKINETSLHLKENGVNLLLTLVDTPGFGDAVDNNNSWNPIIQYIDQKYSDYFTQETKISRDIHIPDQRVHCCLYFISPCSHGLKSLDIEFMKHLHERVNIIPVIAKADTLTVSECKNLKKAIVNEIAEHQIRIYEFPDNEDEGSNPDLKDRFPFAIVGSTQVMTVGGKLVRCRNYPWGTVEVENLEHCDFIVLREMLIRNYMMDLIEVTRNVHYENFRCRQLLSSSKSGSESVSVDLAIDPYMQMEEERQKHELKVRKTEENLEKVCQEKMQEKLQMLAETEAELSKRPLQYRNTLEQKRKEIEKRRQQFEQEKESYGKQHPEFQRYTSMESVKAEKTSPDGGKSSDSPKRRNGGTLSKLFLHK